ncbi:MAG: O-antigen ligase family protein [Candidatus Eremiobacteraeota bacterium]|nr:O-antigen ligase family protein [Candidatus Eremiobacteraeota bacterium]
MLRRGLPATLAFTFFIVPLFPSFITLTAVTVPGISLLPHSLALGLLGLVAVIAVYALAVALVPPRAPVPTLLGLMVWLGASVLSLLLGFDPLAGALFLAIFCLSVLWHVLLMRFYREPGVVPAIYRAYLASGLIAALAAILMVLTKTPAAEYTVGHGRAIGTFILPGELAGYLIIYLPLAFAIARVTTRRDLRLLAIAGLAAGIPAFLMTFSRAGWMGLAVAVAFFVFTQMRRWRGRSALGIIAAAIVAVLFVFNYHHNPSENYTRLSIWQAGVLMFERFPLTGVGPFVFEKIYPFVRLPDGEPTAFHAHSFLLTVAAELGIVGIAAVLFAWWRFIVIFRARLATTNRANATLALAVAAGLLGTWVQGLIDTVSVVIFGLWLPFMAIALCCAQDGLVE